MLSLALGARGLCSAFLGSTVRSFSSSSENKTRIRRFSGRYHLRLSIWVTFSLLSIERLFSSSKVGLDRPVQCSDVMRECLIGFMRLAVVEGAENIDESLKFFKGMKADLDSTLTFLLYNSNGCADGSSELGFDRLIPSMVFYRSVW